MNIIPISSYPIQTSSVQGGGTQASGGTDMPFKSVLQQALANVEETQAVSAQDSVRVALGEVDDLAEVGINTTKAEIAMTLLVQMRNSVLESYNEIMRLNV